MFHGTGMDYGDNLGGAQKFVKMGYVVLVLSYRGYKFCWAIRSYVVHFVLCNRHGHSKGTPSEKGYMLLIVTMALGWCSQGLQRDAQAALEYLLVDEQLSKHIVCPFLYRPLSWFMIRLQRPKILYGQSLGGAVAIDLASRNPTKVRISSIWSISMPHQVPRSMGSSSRIHSLPSQGQFEISQ